MIVYIKKKDLYADSTDEPMFSQSGIVPCNGLTSFWSVGGCGKGIIVELKSNGYNRDNYSIMRSTIVDRTMFDKKRSKPYCIPTPEKLSDWRDSNIQQFADPEEYMFPDGVKGWKFVFPDFSFRSGVRPPLNTLMKARKADNMLYYFSTAIIGKEYYEYSVDQPFTDIRIYPIDNPKDYGNLVEPWRVFSHRPMILTEPNLELYRFYST